MLTIKGRNIFGDSKRSWIIFLIVLMVVVVYYYCVIRYMINFPFSDDFKGILGFTLDYSKAEGKDKFLLLFRQHNEHMIVFCRVITAGYYSLFGKINFTSFNFIGNLSLIPIGYMFCQSFPQARKEHLYIIPVFLILFNIRSFECSFWATVSLTNLWVLVFAIASFFFLHKESRGSLVLSFLCALLATYTLGNGIITFVVSSLVLILNKQFRRFLIWIVLSAASLLLYLTHYIVTPSNHLSLPEVLKRLDEFIKYYFVFVGSVSTSEMVAMWIGGVFGLFFILVSVKKYYKINPVVYSVILFVLLTAFANSITRFHLGSMNALAPRYAINSIFLLLCFYIAMVELLFSEKKRKVIPMILCLLALCFWSWTYTFLPYQQAQKRKFEEAVKNNYIYDLDLGSDKKRERNKKWIGEADELNIFKFKLGDNFEKVASYTLDTSRKIIFAIDTYSRKDSTMSLIGWSFLQESRSTIVYPLIILRNEKNEAVKYIFCQRLYRPDVKKAHKGLPVSELAGFHTEFLSNRLPKGKYSLFVSLLDNNYLVEQKSEITIEIE